MSAPKKTILVTGATGKQGGALITQLLASPQAASLALVAVTRDTTTDRARRLAALPGVTVVAGDFSDLGALFAQLPKPDPDSAAPLWGVYGVQTNNDAEEAQGKALVDAAVAHGARHFVYSSSDRGGAGASDFEATDVKNFAAKYAVEKHLIAQASLSPQRMAYTILRPVSFFDNLGPDVQGRGFVRMWEQLGTTRSRGKLQLVATADIGWFAAAAFLDPAAYAGRAISLVGDELTQPEADAVFREVVGQPMPIGPCLVASTVKWVLKDTAGDMFRWFGDHGYGGSVNECRALHPGMKDFRAWIEENKGKWAK
jgi:uncharacterized protein YbjT (DUF2867 family)